MTIFFAGNELDVFNPVTATCTESASVAAAFDSAFSRCAIACGTTTGGTGTGFTTSVLGNQSKIWLGWQEYINDPNSNFVPVDNMRLINNGGQDVFKRTNASLTLNMQWAVWAGGVSFTNQGALVPIVQQTRVRYDLFIDFPNRIFQLYVGGVILIDVQLPIGAIGYTVNTIQFCNMSRGASSDRRISEIIVADEPTLNLRVLTIPATANGALTQWTGPVTNINELVLNDAAGIDSTTNDELRSFVYTAPTISANFGIKALSLGARCSSNGVAPDKVQGLLRIAGVNYFSASITPGGLSGKSIVFTTNPATASKFTVAELVPANLEFGYASRA